MVNIQCTTHIKDPILQISVDYLTNRSWSSLFKNRLSADDDGHKFWVNTMEMTVNDKSQELDPVFIDRRGIGHVMHFKRLFFRFRYIHYIVVLTSPGQISEASQITSFIILYLGPQIQVCHSNKSLILACGGMWHNNPKHARSIQWMLSGKQSISRRERVKEQKWTNRNKRSWM